MNIGIAQIQSRKGDIPANIEKHIKFIEHASLLQADFIFFPELSLTGYEPELSKKLAVNKNDERFDVLQQYSDQKMISFGVGVPTINESGIYISMIIFQPKQPRVLYSKQQLHEDELTYFENGNEQVLITIKNQKIAPAICYESLQMDHANEAARMGAQIYIASVAKSQNGINKAFAHYPNVAKKYNVPVLMSNCIGVCDNFISSGFSAVWNQKGELVLQFDNHEEGLIIFDTETENVKKKII